MKRLFITILMTLLLLSTPIQAQQGTAMSKNTYAQALLAGGCFWCLESDLDQLPGVIETISGYSGGHTENPDYQEVSAGGSGHAEAVLVTFDPEQISYSQLLDAFWHWIDPTTLNSQFCDHGPQYRTAIFYQNAQQKRQAEASLSRLEKEKPFPDAIMTEISPAGTFYPAEDYHQNYYQKNPLRYRFYRYHCGRDARLKVLWGTAPAH